MGETVHLFIHELFGIYQQKSGVQLLTPVVPKMKSHKMHPGHTYKIARFKYRTWQKPDVKMRQGHSYTLSGVLPGPGTTATVPPDYEYNAHPGESFELSTEEPYCRWNLKPPSQIYQLRLLTITHADRPLFTGKHGKPINDQVKAISLVQVFEYTRDPDEKLQIIDETTGRPIKMDYGLDPVTNSVNLHLWAQIENEAGMTDKMAAAHSQSATKVLVALFQDLDIQGEHSLSVDNLYSTQLPMPAGSVRFVELMTLSERFALLHPGKTGAKSKMAAKPAKFQVFCSGKTCGEGSNLFVDSGD
jgi:hypothetical protein